MSRRLGCSYYSLPKILFIFLVFFQGTFIAGQTKSYLEQAQELVNGPAPHDFDHIEELYFKAIEVGDTLAYNELAKLYWFRQDIEPSPSKVLDYLEKAASQGHWQAFRNLGILYKDGYGSINRDLNKAIKYFNKAIDLGDSYSYFVLGDAYYLKGDPLSKKLGLDSYENGHLKMQNDYSASVLAGIKFILAEDIKDRTGQEKAIKLAEEFQFQEGGSCEYFLYKVYYNDQYSFHNPTKAITYLKKAAEENHKNALYLLGLAYFTGDQVAKDKEKATELFRESIKLGNLRAYGPLGNYMETELKDEVKAKEYYMIATEAGNNSYTPMLGKLLISLEDNLSTGILFMAFDELGIFNTEIALAYHAMTEEDKSNMIKLADGYLGNSRDPIIERIRNTIANSDMSYERVNHALFKLSNRRIYQAACDYFFELGEIEFSKDNLGRAKAYYEDSLDIAIRMYSWIRDNEIYTTLETGIFHNFTRVEDRLMYSYLSPTILLSETYQQFDQYRDKWKFNMAVLKSNIEGSKFVYRNHKNIDSYVQYFEALHKFADTLNNEFSNNYVDFARKSYQAYLDLYESSWGISKHLYNKNLQEYKLTRSDDYDLYLRQFAEEAYIFLIERLISRGAYLDANFILEDVVKVYNSFLPNILLTYSMLFTDFEKAKEQYQKAIKLYPKKPTMMERFYGDTIISFYLSLGDNHKLAYSFANSAFLNKFFDLTFAYSVFQNSPFLEIAFKNMMHLMEKIDRPSIKLVSHHLETINTYKYLGILNHKNPKSRLEFLKEMDPVTPHIQHKQHDNAITAILRFKSAVLDSQLYDRQNSYKKNKEMFRNILQQYFIDPEAPIVRANLNPDRQLEFEASNTTIDINRNIINSDIRNSRLEPEDVLSKLKKSLLIEYYITPSSTNEDYADKIYAFILKEGLASEIFEIGNISDFQKIFDKYNTLVINDIDGYVLKKSLSELSSFLLAPFYKYLESDVEKLLIAPDGIIHNINFATLLDEDNKFLGERFQINHLNSGKDLLYPKHVRNHEAISCIILADPTFDLTDNENEKEGEGFSYQVAQKIPTKNLRDINNGKLSKLPGTRLEAEKIKLILNRANINTTLLLGLDANKKNLINNPSANIVHISTHGFYIKNNQEESGIKDTSFSNNSFLALAGASDTLIKWSKGQTVRDIDLGILTIEDIAKLDLSKTILVTLSACDSGLGNIVPIEGIGGIRRAFQIAGANSLLMTTKKIEDTFSAEYMENFYKYLAIQNRLNPLRAHSETFNHYIKKMNAYDNLLAFLNKVGPFIISSKAH